MYVGWKALRIPKTKSAASTIATPSTTKIPIRNWLAFSLMGRRLPCLAAAAGSAWRRKNCRT